MLLLACSYTDVWGNHYKREFLSLFLFLVFSSFSFLVLRLVFIIIAASCLRGEEEHRYTHTR